MAQSRKPRTATVLSDSFLHQLNMYALAASAAGVGVLALAKPAEAKIVYTPAHESVSRCTHDTNRCPKIDLNHDGVADFIIEMGQSTYGNFSNIFLLATHAASQRNFVAGYETGTDSSVTGVASALFAGEEIDSGLSFAGRLMAGRSRPKGNKSGTCWGPWKNVRKRYLGLKFQINGQTHYGWARLNETCIRTGKVGVEAVLTGYAYETVPNRYIITGKTASDVVTLTPDSLGSLARGSVAGSPK